ncbi:pheromone processing endoprotease [Myotisia sp. PD_48]|nr:pheromone processing endoprotease [Myotisia sp. PD_48]
MKFRAFFGWTVLLIGATNASIYPRDHDTYDYFAVHLHSSLSPRQVEQLLGARHEGQIGELDGHHTFSLPRERHGDLDNILHDVRKRAKRRRSLEAGGSVDYSGLDGLLWSERLSLKKHLHKRIPPPALLSSKVNHRASRSPTEKSPSPVTAQQKEIVEVLKIHDPIFASQWHLLNTEDVGNDLNVTGLWLEGITGEGVTAAVVDDGLDMYSNDLKNNYFAAGSFDFNEKTKEPRPRLNDDKHGTRCAGEIAAVRNDVCGVGVAYDSKVAGVRILSKPVTDEDEAAAVNYKFQDNHIYSCSWGPLDDGATMDAPGLLVRKAMVNGIQKGRGGKGSVFVFAAGNGANKGDNCNFDGYTNSIYSITVGAIDRQNNHPYYSESCSAQLVVTYSSGGGGAIHTTDVGANVCSSGHGGTSAAGPLVVGVVALALSIRPELTWRDLQYLFVETSIPVQEDDGSWQTTSNGKKFSHDFGFGKVDAYSVVQLAKEWKLVKPQAWLHSPWMKVHHDIPQGHKGLTSAFVVTEEMMKKNNFQRIEHVTVTMNVEHTRRGDLSVELRSPSGVVSHLSTTRTNDVERAGYVDWTFMSVAHWGERGEGSWTVIIKDTNVNEFKGKFIDWQLTLWGECDDPKIQKLHPLPGVHDHDHDTSAPASHIGTTTIPPGPTKTSTPTTQTDQVDRPVKPPKPSGTASNTAATAPTETSSASAQSENFLPSPFPTFGVSKRTQIWIYGSMALIIIFCVTLTGYFLIQRRKRMRNNPHDDYEFEMVAEDEEGFHVTSSGVGGRNHKRRGGELYDAFAGDSEEEEQLFSSEDERDGGEVDGDGDNDSHGDVNDRQTYHDEAAPSSGTRWAQSRGAGGDQHG